MSKFTDKGIAALPLPERGSKTVFDDMLPGFGVRLTAKSRTFIVQTGKSDQRRTRAIGKYPSVSLKMARREALRLLDAPTQLRGSKSRSELQAAFLENCATRLRPNTVRRYAVALKKDKPQSPQEIAAFKAMYNWGLRNGHVTENPYQYAQAIFKERERLLSDEEVRAIWHHDRSPFSDIVKLLILTGQRRNQFGQFDQAWIRDDQIHFPGDGMKSKRPHVLPLTSTTVPLVQKLVPFNGWGKSKARLDEESGVQDWVLHDLRRYFSTTMAMIGTPLHITEHLIDHRSSTSGVQAIYMRYGFLPEMRVALENYEKHLHSIVT